MKPHSGPADAPPKPQLSLRDLLDEAMASLFARPGRALLTALGTVIGVAALVATLGLSKTAGNQIVGRFDALAATDVVVTPKAAGGVRAGPSVHLPWDADQRALRLNGVVSAGNLSDVDLRGATISAVPVNDPMGQTEFQLRVKAASPGVFRAVRATAREGRFFDAGHSARADRVVVLGRNAANRLRVTRMDNQPAIFIGDRLYSVIGILESVRRQPALLNAVLLPEGTARDDFGLVAPGSVQVETRIGAAAKVADELPLALSPSDPL
ncbi:MAG: ABC transporter permease, partial [Actinomycetota bacterium]